MGHLMTTNIKYHPLHSIVQGKIEENRRTGRSKLTWIDIRKWLNMTTKIFYCVKNKEYFKQKVAHAALTEK